MRYYPPYKKCGVLKDIETTTSHETKILNEYKEYSITSKADETKLEKDIYKDSRPLRRIKIRIRINN